jgi:hypothetical protein
MSLLEKLKRDRDACFERYKRLENNLSVCQRELELCDMEYGDFNVAIAALEPAPLSAEEVADVADYVAEIEPDLIDEASVALEQLEELKERRDQREEALDQVAEAIKEREEYRLLVERELDDLDRAIAALEPAPIPEPEQTGEGVEIPEGLYTWTATRADWVDPELLPATPDAEPDDASEFADTDNQARNRGYSEYHEGKTHADSPYTDERRTREWQAGWEGADEEAVARLNLFNDEASRAAAIELTADVEPLPQPEWNEPQPEGSAPVTNPEADAIAKAIDYYSPEKFAERNRSMFSIFRREKEEA